MFVLCVISLVTTATADPLPERVQFNRDIRPILSDACFSCHGPDHAQRKADLRFDTESGALSPLADGQHAIVAGKPEASELIRRITSHDGDLVMPPPEFERRLTDPQIALLRRWIEQGAQWEKHWSFVKPVRATLPTVTARDWPLTPVDAFALAKLEREGLAGATEADKSTLLRRITLDLTGLPPTPDEIHEFLAEKSPDAYERVVDRLLASGRYGERMAVRWLNGARYADTSGYQSDGERIMWRWRDWVIDAFTHNLPFDQFTIEQLAGDLLPDPTLEQRIATGFNRNHRGNSEGGIIPDEFAVEYVVDRVETTATVWLGLTVMCARCHDHKYDPLTQQEFYQLYAYFNQLPEKGRALKYGNSPPVLVSPTRDQQQQWQAFNRRAAAMEAACQKVEPEVAHAQAVWEQTSLPNPPAADAMGRRLILHFPLEENAVPRISLPAVPTRPIGYLGQAPLLITNPTGTPSGPVESGNPRFGPGRFGQGLECDGVHDAAVGNVANFGFFDKFTIAAWIQPQGARGGTILSRMTDVAHGDGWGIVLEQGKLQVHLTKRWLDDACRVETAAAINPQDWSQITVSYDGSREAAGIRIYVNGLPQQTVTLLDELYQSFDNPKSLLRIGGGNGPAGRFSGRIDDVRLFDRAVSADEAQALALPDQLTTIAATPVDQRTAAQRLALREFFVQFAADESIRQLWQQRHTFEDERQRFIEGLPTTMVMEEVPGLRQTFVLLRGEYDKRGDPVSSGVPASLPPLPQEATRDRLGLGKWLVDAENPLTARVAVNRFWQMLFGIGLVKTIDDFGQQGEWPSHPELLDWLAVEFQEGGPAGNSFDNSAKSLPQTSPAPFQWDAKRLIRQVVTSAVYRQSSKMSAELQQRDPENRLLARGPRFRLSAEMIRDRALAASGLLVEQVGGPSVKPYQPDGLWLDLAGMNYDQDHGAGLYRRSLYTYWKRTIAPPAMVTFDAAGRETCIVKEFRTNTPLQALNLMNDITYSEAARVLGERMMVEGGALPANRLRRAFLLVLGRQPSESEQSVLLAGYQRHLAFYQDHQDDAESLTKQGESPRQPDLNLAELAACTTMAGLILNLDESVTRE